MIVLRVEHRITLLGPYRCPRSIISTPLLQLDHPRNAARPKRPEPEDDGLAMDRDDYYNHLFGFIDFQALDEWFPLWIRKKLLELDEAWSISWYNAEVVRMGIRQLTFDRRSSTLLRQEPVTFNSLPAPTARDLLRGPPLYMNPPLASSMAGA